MALCFDRPLFNLRCLGPTSELYSGFYLVLHYEHGPDILKKEGYAIPSQSKFRQDRALWNSRFPLKGDPGARLLPPMTDSFHNCTGDH